MKLVAEYIYRDAAGHPLRCRVRYAEPKTFMWQTYCPYTDSWPWRATRATPTSTLYHLEMIAAERPERVFVTEGEKDADNVIALGLPAVTSGNAGTWQRHHSEQLHEHGCRTAIVLPDHDKAGDDHAFDVARCNLAIGIRTKIVRLPDLADKEDVSDFIERGGTRAGLLALVDGTTWTTLPDVPPAAPETPTRKTTTYTHDPKLNGIFFEALKLPKTVTGQLMVVCPFHPDAKPSLSLDLDQGVWYCHGCQTGGGVVVFYMKIAKLDGRVVTRSEAWRRLRATYL
jgi:CHC2 zinc finger/Toprim-like